MPKDRDATLWLKLLDEGLEFGDGDTNTKFQSFQEMSRRFGKAWITYLKAAYEAKDELMDDESFSRLNAGVPVSFIRKNLQNGS